MFKLEETKTRPITEEEKNYYDSGQWRGTPKFEEWQGGGDVEVYK